MVAQEPELTAPVDLCLPDGRLNPRAVGWARQPLVRANLRGWGRNKRFEYWCVFSPEVVVALNISHSDYRVTLASFVLDLATLRPLALAEVHWLPRGRVDAMPAVSGQGSLSGRGDDLAIHMDRVPEGTRLRARAQRLEVDILVEEPEGHESMCVVVPWDEKRFQYTRKDTCLKASGTVVADGRSYRLGRDDSYATLDHGRGRWPYRIVWNWAAGSGRSDGHEIGLQFGGKWTDGTPSTENSLKIDGRVHKISEELEWIYDRGDFMKPWIIRGSGVDLTFTPVYDRQIDFNRLIVRSREDQCFGHFNGTIRPSGGEVIRVANIFGWAEEVARRW